MYILTLVTYKNNRQEEFIKEDEELSNIEDYVNKYNFNNSKELHNYAYHLHSQKCKDIDKEAKEHFWLQYKEI